MLEPARDSGTEVGLAAVRAGVVAAVRVGGKVQVEAELGHCFGGGMDREMVCPWAILMECGMIEEGKNVSPRLLLYSIDVRQIQQKGIVPKPLTLVIP